MAGSHPIGHAAAPATVTSDRSRTLFRRLRVVAVLMVVVAGVDLVDALVGGSPIPSAVGFALAVALLAVVLELGVVLFATEDEQRPRDGG